MSLFYDEENYELTTSVEVDGLLADLPFELIKESIREQIEDPTGTNINYIDVIIEKCNTFKELHDDNPELITQINDSIDEFFTSIITDINDRFDLGLDIETIKTTEDIIEVGTAIYTYFILRYVKNVGKFITKYIISNKASIASNFNNEIKKDVSTAAFKKQIKNKDDLIIVSNLASIIKSIINLEIDSKTFIELSTGSDSYERAILIDLIDTDKLIGDFVKNYLDIVIDIHDYILDSIYTEIKTRILKKVMN